MSAGHDIHAGYLLRTPIPDLVKRSVPPAILAALLGGMQLYVDYLVAAYTLPVSAVAAVAASQPLQYLVFAMEALIAVGAANVVSAKLGRGDLHARRTLAATLNQLTVGAGLLLAVSAPLLVPLFQSLVALDGIVAEEAYRYLTVLLTGSVLLFASAARLSLLQAIGRMGAVFGSLAAGTTVNAIASALAVWWLDLGIVGIASGTVAGWLTSTIAAECALRRCGLGVPAVLAGADRVVRMQILRVGHSGMLIHLLFFVQTAAMFRAVGVHGDSLDAAVLGAAFRVVMLGVYVATGVARAMQPVLAASHAAGLRERVAEILRAYRLAAFLSVGVLALLVALLAERVLMLMLPGHAADTQDLAYFRTYVLVLPALPVLLLSLVRLQATERALGASLLALLRVFGLFLPLLYLTTGMLGVGGVYASLLATEWLLVPIVLSIARRAPPRPFVGTSHRPALTKENNSP